ncbi:MAG TPA: cytochrome c maturation protein CcmE [Cyclobacteriaceae bacterium]|jgi:cytochrome c-type biogenesis protein CcmE
MKISHIILIAVIAAAVGIIITSAGDASTYVTFDQARELANSGNPGSLHVVGELKKDSEGDVVGISRGKDMVSFSFVMVDDNGMEQQVQYNQPMPADFTKSEKVVVVGSYHDDTFIANKILLKCPSKYQEQKQLTTGG